MVSLNPIAGPSTPPSHNTQHELITSSMVMRRRRPAAKPQVSSSYSPPTPRRSQQQQPLRDTDTANQHDSPSAGNALEREEHSSFYSSLHYISNGDSILPSPLKGRQKKMNQWRRWTDKIIPSLIAPYLTYLRKLTSLHNRIELQPDEVATFQCKLSCRWRVLDITCILFNRYFACTPIAPSLAVDLQLLELVKTLFVHITPNTTAWCETLEVFLAGRGYHLTTKDNLRRQFGNAYHWYSVLFMSADDHLSNLIGTHHPLPLPSTEGLTCPSDYLRSRCPICFGLDDWRKSRTHNLKPDIHTCIDACFTQKRSSDQRSGGPNPPNPVRLVFLSDNEVTSMEVHVRSCRGRPLDRGRKRKRPAATEEEGDDYEDGMRVPISVLDGCGDSFLAADKKHKKASTQFFADTGVMVMLCRHDCVLWLANMTSAGEKQHYALALIKKLFNNLPTNMTVGLLYDIGCQLHQSCLKYQLLDDAVLRRITFAISVFHTYGHQWACQIIYHPRKCEGFGLSDGEGCECLWSALKHLIAPLRVSGFHQQLFVLNTQVRHLDDKNLSLYGNWLIRRWNNCIKKKSTATQALHELSVNEICFEIEKLERSYRQAVNKRKLNSHVDAAIQRRNPTIRKLVSTYNNLCADLSALIRQRRSPLNAIPPNPISPTADEDTRAAIRLLLEIDRCNKEESRVKVERCALQEWAMREWDGLQRARAHANDDEAILYHMNCHARQFIVLVLGWQMKVHPIPCAWPMPDCWGPSQTKLANGTPVVYPDDPDDEDHVSDDGDDWESDIGCGDEELMDFLEDIALTDQYRGQEEHDIEGDYIASRIEIGAYIPLFTSHTSIRKICFIGDAKGLPPYGQDDIQDLKSIFDVKHLKDHALFLNTQYRMPPQIENFISQAVYDGLLESNLQHPVMNERMACHFINIPSQEQ
ncbi:hypothetical protein EV702DRAFT_1248386 [Suillus placidus]|uniref:CxC1-like cysteine cluster associated with KDZ transposases domain-containing protein n=1 Tax=Suillus placidus TaxID=48579 RepID=A0A9P7A3F1_9AGAM|nr:hypothetical protein EV702DRAFT_1248386 [Suillus placidus]